MKKAFILFSALILLLSCAPLAGAEVVINEIMTDNGLFDAKGNAYDWIELWNAGASAVDLSGWGLSDRKSDLYAFTFPQGTTLKAGEYLLVYCCGDDQYKNNTGRKIYYANFKLSKSGETIRLTDRNGNDVQTLKYPQQLGNTAYGLASGGSVYGFLPESTPRKQNSAAVYQEKAPMPEISPEAGFFSASVTVTITSDFPVRYTLDGSEPTAKSTLYAGPFTVKQTAVVRAKAFPSGALPSYVSAASYIINDPASTPVISFSTDRKYLYEPATGLFVRGDNGTANYNTEWEYPLHMEYFDENGQRQINQTTSFHIVGTSTRGQRQKSFAVYARTAYGGESRFFYNPFENRDYESYRSFTIRSTGSDAPYCRMRDLVLSSLAKGLGIMYLDGKTVIVYMNGAYLGQYNIREKANKYSIAQWEGITDPDIIDQIDVIEGEAREDQVQNGDRSDWLALRSFVRSHDLNVPENLKYVTDRLDVDSLFTWACFEIAIMNEDLENVRVYRVPGGKWKYMLYDVEAGGTTHERAVYMLIDSSKAGSRLSSQYSLISKLLQVPEYRDKFLRKLAQVIENSFLYSETVKPAIDKNYALLYPLMPRQFALYANTNMRDWQENVLAFSRTMRILPRRVIKTVSETLKLTEAEKETYFGALLIRLDETNAEEVN